MEEISRHKCVLLLLFSQGTFAKSGVITSREEKGRFFLLAAEDGAYRRERGIARDSQGFYYRKKARVLSADTKSRAAEPASEFQAV